VLPESAVRLKDIGLWLVDTTLKISCAAEMRVRRDLGTTRQDGLSKLFKSEIDRMNEMMDGLVTAGKATGSHADAGHLEAGGIEVGLGEAQIAKLAHRVRFQIDPPAERTRTADR
jgi:hypothetical protein